MKKLILVFNLMLFAGLAFCQYQAVEQKTINSKEKTIQSQVDISFRGTPKTTRYPKYNSCTHWFKDCEAGNVTLPHNYRCKDVVGCRVLGGVVNIDFKSPHIEKNMANDQLDKFKIQEGLDLKIGGSIYDCANDKQGNPFTTCEDAKSAFTNGELYGCYGYIPYDANDTWECSVKADGSLTIKITKPKGKKLQHQKKDF